MSVKGNQFRSNSFKQDTEPSKIGQKQTTSKAPELRQIFYLPLICKMADL